VVVQDARGARSKRLATPRRPRVTVVSRIFSPEPSAASFRLEALARGLLAAGAATRVVTAQPSEGSTVADPPGLRVSRAPVLRDATGYVRGYLPYLSFDVPLALRLLAEPAPDVYVCEPPPTTGAVVRAVAALKGRPYVYYAADVWSDASQSTGSPGAVVGAVRLAERFALSGARTVLAVSDGVAQRVTALGGRDVVVVPNGVDTRTFAIDGSPPPDAPAGPFLVYAGTASEWQGAEVFAEAMSRVRARVPDARLVYVGQGSSWPTIQRIAAGLPAGAVQMRGIVPPEEAAAWQRAATGSLVSIRPGLGYDFAYPTKVLASLACGTEVLYAGPGPAGEDLRTYGLGRAVDYDVAQVADAMVAMLTAPRMPGAAARLRAWVTEHRSLDATGRQAAANVLRAAAPAGER
jgi:glycosyltransferase involved in cell wall biosynthesis